MLAGQKAQRLGQWAQRLEGFLRVGQQPQKGEQRADVGYLAQRSK
ncbi:MAG: hypothetical protein NTZ23_05935 [Cyanobium sp. LacPavin_0920_WC12_MAG_63_22]|nr:hypothetical protein [Cyanobium sp. LacPavin_0920_WC12_MAG_63_22]